MPRNQNVNRYARLAPEDVVEDGHDDVPPTCMNEGTNATAATTAPATYAAAVAAAGASPSSATSPAALPARNDAPGPAPATMAAPDPSNTSILNNPLDIPPTGSAGHELEATTREELPPQSPSPSPTLLPAAQVPEPSPMHKGPVRKRGEDTPGTHQARRERQVQVNATNNGAGARKTASAPVAIAGDVFGDGEVILLPSQPRSTKQITAVQNGKFKKAGELLAATGTRNAAAATTGAPGPPVPIPTAPTFAPRPVYRPDLRAATTSLAARRTGIATVADRPPPPTSSSRLQMSMEPIVNFLDRDPSAADPALAAQLRRSPTPGQIQRPASAASTQLTYATDPDDNQAMDDVPRGAQVVLQPARPSTPDDPMPGVEVADSAAREQPTAVMSQPAAPPAPPAHPAPLARLARPVQPAQPMQPAPPPAQQPQYRPRRGPRRTETIAPFRLPTPSERDAIGRHAPELSLADINISVIGDKTPIDGMKRNAHRLGFGAGQRAYYDSLPGEKLVVKMLYVNGQYAGEYTPAALTSTLGAALDLATAPGFPDEEVMVSHVYDAHDSPLGETVMDNLFVLSNMTAPLAHALYPGRFVGLGCLQFMTWPWEEADAGFITNLSGYTTSDTDLVKARTQSTVRDADSIRALAMMHVGAYGGDVDTLMDALSNAVDVVPIRLCEPNSSITITQFKLYAHVNDILDVDFADRFAAALLRLPYEIPGHGSAKPYPWQCKNCPATSHPVGKCIPMVAGGWALPAGPAPRFWQNGMFVNGHNPSVNQASRGRGNGRGRGRGGNRGGRGRGF
ncbi:hypothetical protein AURDEDRAFT_172088 [Auricularia subglabra TFB-10046 SS5]|nr:hypothetical protein AURDEDRAFT_172088 [Auricularia subglabra TFB-10046 SS5]